MHYTHQRCPEESQESFEPSLISVFSPPLKPWGHNVFFWVYRECKRNKHLKDLFPWTQKVTVTRTNINTLCLAQKAAGTGERQIWCLAHGHAPSLAVPTVLKGRTCHFSVWLQALLSLEPGLYLQRHLLPPHPQRCLTRLPSRDHSSYSDCLIQPFSKMDCLTNQFK